MSVDDPNVSVSIHLHVPAWVKQLIVEAAAVEGMSMSEYCAHGLHVLARDTIGVPLPPSPATPIPGVADVLRAYVEGTDRLIGPCGKTWPCSYAADESKWIGDAEFCGSCNVRVH